VRLTFNLCLWKQNHVELLFIYLYHNTDFEHGIFLLLWNSIILAFRVYFGHLSLILCLLFVFVTRVLDPLVRKNDHVDDTSGDHSLPDLLRVTHSNKRVMMGVFIPLNLCLDFHVGLMNFIRSLKLRQWPFLTGGLLLHPSPSTFFLLLLLLLFNIARLIFSFSTLKIF
jgi:hypothetical protein